jgi:hypothetical protein
MKMRRKKNSTGRCLFSLAKNCHIYEILLHSINTRRTLERKKEEDGELSFIKLECACEEREIAKIACNTIRCSRANL